MKKKVLMAVVFSLMATTLAMAQSFTVKGMLVDSLTSEGISFVTVRVYKQGAVATDKPVTMFVSDANGCFSHQMTSPGSYVAVCSSVSKADLRKNFAGRAGQVVDLGTLQMQDDAQVLGAVEVVAQKPIVKMETDKVTYSVEADESAKTQTVLEMLRKVPMVTVDAQDNITVNGSSSFKVYVDGKPNLLMTSNPSEVFRSMPASSVKDIEVVTNPGAKYDAEGTGAVLNLTMASTGAAKTDKAFAGSAGLRVGTSDVGGDLNLSGQQKKLSYNVRLWSNYSFQPKQEGVAERSSSSSTMETLTSKLTRGTWNSLVLGLGYDIDSLNQVNVEVVGTYGHWKNTFDQVTTLYASGSTAPLWAYAMDGISKSDWTSLTISADYQHFLNRRRSAWYVLVYQYQLEGDKSDRDREFSLLEGSAELDLADKKSLEKTNVAEHVVQLDYTNKITDEHQLEAGAKLTYHRDKSDDDLYDAGVYDADGSMEFRFLNTIIAGYAQYAYSGKKWSGKAGLRYEHTFQEVSYLQGSGSDFNTNYGNLVPNATLSYQISKSANIGLNYNLRISRPSIWYLNPYVDATDPTSVNYGNPDLNVMKTHRIALVFNYFNPKWVLNLNLSEQICGNMIDSYSFLKDDVTYSTYGNIVKRASTALRGFVRWMPHRNTTLMLNGGVGYNDYRSKELDLHNDGWEYNYYVMWDQTWKPSLKSSLFAFAQGRSYSLEGWSGLSGVVNMVGMSVTKNLLDDRLTLGISGITGLRKNGKVYYESHVKTNSYTSDVVYRSPLASLRFSVTYKFGNTKYKAKQHSTNVESDYMGGGSGGGGGTSTP